MAALDNGHPREDFLKPFLSGKGPQELSALGFHGLQNPADLKPLSTVPHKPIYDDIKLDVTNLPDMVIQAVKQAHLLRPDIQERIAKKGDVKDVKFEKQVAYELMTEVLGILRANGIDAKRAIAFPDTNDVGNPGRYVPDQLRIGDGPQIDVFGGDDSGAQFIEQEGWSRLKNLETKLQLDE